jgi:hypothetical protein
MAGHLLINSGSNESSLAPQFKWLDNTFNVVINFKTIFYLGIPTFSVLSSSSRPFISPEKSGLLGPLTNLEGKK